MSVLFTSFRARAVLTTCATACVAALATIAVAFPVGKHAAEDQLQHGLDQKATLAGDLVVATSPARKDQVVDLLRRQGLTVYFIRAGRADRDGLPAPVVTRVAAGVPVSGWSEVGGHHVALSAVPLPLRGNGLVLTEQQVSGPLRVVRQGLILALLAGLLAGAAAGTVLARLVTRPVRRAADAAKKMSAGERHVRLPVTPPAELAELAGAINELGVALAISENRERDFLLAVSHDLRTPLVTIQGYAEGFVDGAFEADETAQAGATLLAETERLNRLIADLLLLARIDTPELTVEMVQLELTQLATAAADAWRPRCAARDVVLRTELPHGPVTVCSDPARVRQVVDGLCENALRAAPPGVPLILAVRAVPGAGIVEVRDGGPGFTDDDLQVAFEPGELFQRYRGTRKVGSGLGLALAARLIRRLGGTIEAGHAPEGGARFTITLPHQPPPALLQFPYEHSGSAPA
jgi:two-component system sensor histidine kinase BaeS